MSNVIAAIILALLAYTMLNIGLVMQKKGASDLPQVEHQSLTSNIKNFATNKIWMVGLILTSVQYLLYLLALDYGSLSLVSAFTGWGIVVLVLFSFFYLKEPLSRVEAACIAVVAGGVVVLGLTSPNVGVKLDPSTVNQILAQPVSIVFLAVIVAFCFCPVIFSWKRGFWHADVILGACSGVANSIGAIFANALVAFISVDNIGGTLGSAMGSGLFWLFLFLVLAGNMISMVYQQIAYQKGQANLILPLYTIVSTVVPVLSGIIMFQDWGLVNPGVAGLRAACIVVITVGAAALAYFNSKYAQMRNTTAELNG
ncbi:MAG TPA: DMT family transporter [Candidatus Lokiarchaeia archaeon]|nr:DMT family transporter [Candidatus Lokiarchaeia archaeon]